MHFLIVIYTACKTLANWWWLFLGRPSSHFDLEEWQKYPPAGFCGGGRIPPVITNIFKKIASLSILNGFERSTSMDR